MLAAGVAGLGVSLLLGGPVGWVAGVVAAVVLVRRLGGLESASSAREARRTEEALPLVADLLSAAVAAGAPPVVAVRVVGEATGGPLGHRLVDAARVAELGGDATDSWVGLAQHPPLARLARTLSAAGERGIAPAEALARLGADARDAARWSAEARAQALGARAAAPLGLCFLPAFVLVGVVPAVAAAGSLLP